MVRCIRTNRARVKNYLYKNVFRNLLNLIRQIKDKSRRWVYEELRLCILCVYFLAGAGQVPFWMARGNSSQTSRAWDLVSEKSAPGGLHCTGTLWWRRRHSFWYSPSRGLFWSCVNFWNFQWNGCQGFLPIPRFPRPIHIFQSTIFSDMIRLSND